MFSRVNTESIKIVFRDEVLVGADQNIQDRARAIHRADSLLADRSRVIFNYQLPLRKEITFHEPFWSNRIIWVIAATPEECLFLQIARVDSIVNREISAWRNLILPISPGKAITVQPLIG